IVRRVEVRPRRARASHRVERGAQPPVPEWFERRERGVQSEKAVEVERGARALAARWLRDRDVRPELVVRPFVVGDHDVERVRGATLEEAAAELPLPRQAEFHPERRAAEERRGEPHRDEGDGARLEEVSAVHADSGEGRRAKSEERRAKGEEGRTASSSVTKEW